MILKSRFSTPIGSMFVCATEQGICLLEFEERKTLDSEYKELQKLLGTHIIAGENSHTQQTKKEIAEYFEGQRKTFTVSLHMPGTPFQQKVWENLTYIPYGETRTYLQQAEKIGNLNAVRAVGTANGRNRISIMVPCHRVIGKDGKLHGYGGGLERKRWLLDHESRNS